VYVTYGHRLLAQSDKVPVVCHPIVRWIKLHMIGSLTQPPGVRCIRVDLGQPSDKSSSFSEALRSKSGHVAENFGHT
jgi:hypothetical protein